MALNLISGQEHPVRMDRLTGVSIASSIAITASDAERLNAPWKAKTHVILGGVLSMLVMGGRGRRAGDHAIRFSVWKPDGSSFEDANAR